MNKWILLYLEVLVACCSVCYGSEPIRPSFDSVGFMVYFRSRYRGVCMGTLVNRMVVMTAAVCVVDPIIVKDDLRSINVIVGTNYRHPKRGLRVPITKIIRPAFSEDVAIRGYEIQKSVVLMLLKKKIPDLIAEVPLRIVEVDTKAEQKLGLQQECFTFGWHYFHHDSKVYTGNRFLLQRYLRAQFLTIVKMYDACEALTIKFQHAISNFGFKGYMDLEQSSMICARDIDKAAQPCHGMYGAPLVCQNKVVAILTSPDAQWSNCTGYSNIWHSISSSFLTNFLACTQGLFEDIEHLTDWTIVKNSLNLEVNGHDIAKVLYSKFDAQLSSSLEDD